MWRLEAKSRGTQVSMIAPPRATNMEEHDESVEEVAVDAIVSHKLNVAENRVEYLIQWSENGKTTYTWEPEENAVDADDLIYQYWCLKQGSSHAAALDNVNAARRIAPRSNLAEDQAPPSLPPLSEARPAARLPPLRSFSQRVKHVSRPTSLKRYNVPCTYKYLPYKIPYGRCEKYSSSSSSGSRSPSSSGLPTLRQTEAGPVGEWDDQQAQVHALQRVNNHIETVVEVQGRTLTCSLHTAYQHCPQAMLAFYQTRVL